MIQFANKETTYLVRQMWKTCFGDTDQFMDLFFSRVYRPENTLIYWEGEEAVASLQMLPYTITFYGKRTPFYYMAGLCTLPEHRKKGYMAKLIERSHQVMEERDVPLAILIPADEWLFGFYNKYGYEQVFEQDETPIVSLRELIDTTKNITEAYTEFDALQQSHDFCVQKTFEDFVTMVEDAKMDNYPAKTNLSAMAFVGNPQYLLSLYAAVNPEQELYIELEGVVHHQIFRIGEGKCIPVLAENGEVVVDIRMLSRLLFGYKISELSTNQKAPFQERSPIINYMLE